MNSKLIERLEKSVFYDTEGGAGGGGAPEGGTVVTGDGDGGAPASEGGTVVTGEPGGEGEGGDPGGEPGGEPAGEGGAPAGEPNETKAPEGAPEKYEDFTVPEGVEVDGEQIEKFKELARELNLTQESAQKFVDLQTKMAARHIEAFQAEQAKWVSSLQTEWGGEFKANVQKAQRAMSQFGSPELRQLLDSTGFGNHPAVAKMMVAVGNKLGDPDFVEGKSATQVPKTAAEILYPNQGR